ncbi:MAG TPA: hypothetical protein VLL94_04785, partial [Nitrospiraceae bacterium]|nr:hypothetical protein [Nitrospiraceae bacterium]
MHTAVAFPENELRAPDCRPACTLSNQPANASAAANFHRNSLRVVISVNDSVRHTIHCLRHLRQRVLIGQSVVD